MNFRPFVEVRAPRGFRIAPIASLVGVVLAMGGVAIVVNAYATPTFHSPRDATERVVKALQASAKAWRANHPSLSCPTVAQLKAEKELPASTALVDEWGSAYVIRCTDDETTAMSSGLDRTAGTDDDIAFPDTRAK